MNLNRTQVAQLQALMGTILSLGCIQLSHAHVSVTSGTAYANGYYQVDLSVPHGCEGADTYRVEVVLPAGFPPVRAVLGPLGYATIEAEADTGLPTRLTWEKPEDELLESDSHTYEVSFRTKLPAVEFVRYHFPTTQYCRDTQGVESTAAWVGINSSHDHGGGSGGADAGEKPAPSLFVYPPRSPGWNQYTAPDHLHDMSIFRDAQIVWKGSAAYSPNPVTQQLIEDDSEATTLEQIHPGEVFWIKY
ncbi:MAG: DUF1775 domain-containing protein [Pseudomonadota bacterium]|nr:DUF1775 domain-containing protein [Pseudomonadota bacterium]